MTVSDRLVSVPVGERLAVNVGHLIASYGYLALFALIGAESMGVPLPGETALITAAIYAGSTHNLSPWAVFAVAATAAIVGDNIGYWIGAKGGYRLARAHGHWVRLDEHKLKVARYLFDTYGLRVVFLGRFVAILRTYAAFLAGISRMRWRRFLVANAAGGIIWAGAFTLAAYLAGATLRRVSGTIAIIIVAVAVAVVVIAGVIIAIRRRTGRLAARAEAAYPGPLE